jgi:hypothetical protein
MPKSRGRKPKKNRAPSTAAPKKRLDTFNTTPQAPPLSTQPPQGRHHRMSRLHQDKTDREAFVALAANDGLKVCRCVPSSPQP